MFSYALSDLPEAVGHDAGDGEEVVARLEASDREVAAVLDGLVATGGRHILRHGGGGVGLLRGG